MQNSNLYRHLVENHQYPQFLNAVARLESQGVELGDDVRVLKAGVLEQVGRRDEADSLVAALQARVAQFDDDTLVDWAAVLIARQAMDDAATVLDEVLARNARHALALARLAYCHMAQSRYATAVPLLQRSLAVEPQRIIAWTNLASCLCELARWDEAQAAIDDGHRYLAAAPPAAPPAARQPYRQLLLSCQLSLWAAAERDAEAEQFLAARKADDDGVAADGGSAGGSFGPTPTWVQLSIDYSRALSRRDRHEQAISLLRDILAEQPDCIPLLLQLSELASVQGRLLPAARLLRRALVVLRDRLKDAGDDARVKAPVLAEITALHLRLAALGNFRFEEASRQAIDAATQSLAEIEDSPAGRDALGVARLAQLSLQLRHARATHAFHAEEVDTAESLFGAILAEFPNHLPSLQIHGQMLLQLGRIDEALAMFERVKAIDPVRGYAAMASARQYPDDDAMLERMERVARQPSIEGQERAGILFQLAMAWEKKRDYDKAFELARSANESAARHLEYDPASHRDQCARIRQRFSRALYTHRPGHGVASRLPVFVVGMPRSGTTLVEQVLSGHSRIFGAGELGVIPQVIQGINRWERHVGSGRSYPDCMDDIDQSMVEGIAGKVLQELREYDDGAEFVVDKLPHNFENIGLIKYLFPEARIISVRRDPRDIALSNYFTDYQAKFGGMGFAYDLRHIGEQLADHNLLMHHWHSVFPGEILELAYEDVVDDLEGSARRMLEYIGVEWESAVLKFNEQERAIKTASVWQVRQPIYTTSKEKWRRYQAHLAPLIAGTNARIEPADTCDMATLPEAGWFTGAVALFREDRLDEAEFQFKKLLHHVPEHAAANYMVGLIYLRKNHVSDGIALLEKAHERCPWHKEWRDNLAKAYRLTGEVDKATALDERAARRQRAGESPVIMMGDALDTLPGIAAASSGIVNAG